VETTEYDEQAIVVMDAFLVFRAFAKLASKEISVERCAYNQKTLLTNLVLQI
jgi:hypothetical protein